MAGGGMIDSYDLSKLGGRFVRHRLPAPAGLPTE